MLPGLSQKNYWLIGILLMISVAAVIKGCDSDHSGGPATTSARTQQSGIGMKISGASEMQAKALGVTIAGVGLDDLGNPTDVTAEPVVISNPVFPLDVPLIVFVPPCRWRITVTVSLTRDRPRIKSTDIDACSSVTIDLPVETFEAMYIPSGSDPLQVPESAQAGETLVVSCGGVPIDAPDSDSEPLVATVSEQAGSSVSGPIDATNSVSGPFPDPYELSSPEEQRVFHCTISDGRSPAQSFRKAVRRLPTAPSPTETPTPTPTPTPTETPPPTPTETPTPTATPTPLPIILYRTSNQYNANLAAAGGFPGDGRAGADALCNASALRPAGYANYRAFISINSTDTIANMPGNYGINPAAAIISLTGTPLGSNWADLLDGSLPPGTDLINAGVVPGPYWWSGSTNNGAYSLGLGITGCNFWTSSTFSDGYGRLGAHNQTSPWLSTWSWSCNSSAYVLCVAYN